MSIDADKLSATSFVISDKMSATMDAKDTSFGEWLAEQMELRDLSQADVARRAGLSRQAVSDYVNGKRTKPDSDALNGLAHALKLPPEEVHRAAGKLPKKDAKSQWIEKADYYLSQMPPEQQEYWVHLIEAAAELDARRRRGENGPDTAEV